VRSRQVSCTDDEPASPQRRPSGRRASVVTIPAPSPTPVGAALDGGQDGTKEGPFAGFSRGFKDLQKSIAAATAANGTDTTGSPDAASSSSEAGSGNTWGAWANNTRKMVAAKAREVAYEVVPQASVQPEGASSNSSSSPSTRQPSDVEKGEGGQFDFSVVGNWAKTAAKNVQRSASNVANGAKSLEIGEQANNWRSQVSTGFGQIAENASSASAGLSEKAKLVQGSLKDVQSKGAAKFSDAKTMAAARAEEAKRLAAKGASGAKGALSSAGQSLQGLAALTTSPAKLAQFGGVFFVGIFLITMSFSFLPMLVVSPQKFALLFAFGSMTLLSSFAILKGPQAFLTSLIARDKLPFSGAYVIGLVGTLVATIGMRSFILTAVFGIIQAFALLYFLASYVPGGQVILNMCGKCCSKGARAVSGRLIRT